MIDRWVEEARRRLLGLRQGAGAWGYRAGTVAAAEPSALAGLALLATETGMGSGERVAAEVGAWLGSIQRRDGSVGLTEALPEVGWASPLVSLLWAALGEFANERRAGVGWMVATRGKPTPKVHDDPLGHDGRLIGWPWVADTHSWVEPTAMTLLALGREGQGGHPRAIEGVRVLRDRAVPGGGWNLGNPIVFHTPLRPLPGPTGLALLALAKVDGPSPAIEPGLATLRAALGSTLAPTSIGWGLLGLRAWAAAPAWAPERLRLAFERLATREASVVELALLLLAAGERSAAILGVRFPEPAEASHV